MLWTYQFPPFVLILSFIIGSYLEYRYNHKSYGYDSAADKKCCHLFFLLSFYCRVLCYEHSVDYRSACYRYESDAENCEAYHIVFSFRLVSFVLLYIVLLVICQRTVNVTTVIAVRQTAAIPQSNMWSPPFVLYLFCLSENVCCDCKSSENYYHSNADNHFWFPPFLLFSFAVILS